MKYVKDPGEQYYEGRCMVHAYKYNGWLYRTVEYPTLLKLKDGNLAVFIRPQSTKFMKAKENSQSCFCSFSENPIVWFFFRDEWFNVKVIFEGNEIKHYVNIASPFVFEEEAVKYIDFDLDLKMDEGSGCRVVDKNEYQSNGEKWGYSEKVKKQVEGACERVKKLYDEGWFKKLFTREDFVELEKDLMKHG